MQVLPVNLQTNCRRDRMPALMETINQQMKNKQSIRNFTSRGSEEGARGRAHLRHSHQGSCA